MDRRTFVASGVALTGGAIALSTTVASPAGAAVRTAKTVTPGARTGHYWQHLAPLKATAFLKLPPGAVQPRGWIRTQLNIEADGLCGRMPEASDYLQPTNCGWVDKTKGAWEELPYWLRGFGDLGYVTGNTRILTLARQWIDGIIANQGTDGFFGPQLGRPALGRQHRQRLLAVRPHRRDLAARPGAEDPRGVGRLHQRHPELAQREPGAGLPGAGAVRAARPGPEVPAATYRDYDTVMGLYGNFPGGGFAGDENCRPGTPTRSRASTTSPAPTASA